MKIIIVNDYARIVGGAAKIAIMSAIAFAEQGHDVEFFAGNGEIGPELVAMPQIKVTCLGDLPHNRDPKPLRGMIRGLWYRRAARAMKALLAQCDPAATIVHFHAYRDILTTSVAQVAADMGFVTVYTAHEYTLGCPYGGFFDFRRNHICPLTGLSAACFATRCNRGSYFKKLWYYAAEFVFAKISRIPSKLSHVVFISKLNQEVLKKYLPPLARHTIVSNAFDYAQADAAPISEGSPFLFIGQLEIHKDPLTAARAARILGADITFVGSGPQEEAIRREYPDAELKGWVSRTEVEATIQQCRALVFPSVWYEAQPGTTMEAAACGLPIIVADKSAAVEQVEALGVGAVFKGGDAEDLADRLRPYLDTAYAREQGKATQEAYRRVRLSKDAHIAKLMEIYTSELALMANGAAKVAVVDRPKN